MSTLDISSELSPSSNSTEVELQVAFEQWQELPLSLKEQLARDCVDSQTQKILRSSPSPNLAELRHRLRQQPVPIYLISPFARVDTGRIGVQYWVRNLYSHGGILSCIKLFVHHADKEASALARELSRLNPGEVRMVRPPFYNGSRKAERFSGLHWSWGLLNASNILYIRAEDDVVFIEDGALEMLASAILMKGNTREWLMLSANMINSYTSPYFHSVLGAFKPPFAMQYTGDHYRNVSIMWQQHTQFLNRSMSGESLLPYHFAGTWDLSSCRFASALHGFDTFQDIYHGHPRWGLHLCAIMGPDLPHWRSRSKPVTYNEEQYLTSFWPSQKLRPQGIVGMALAVHFEFAVQSSNQTMEERDELLSKYHDLARQYCSAPLRTEL